MEWEAVGRRPRWSRWGIEDAFGSRAASQGTVFFGNDEIHGTLVHSDPLTGGSRSVPGGFLSQSQVPLLWTGDHFLRAWQVMAAVLERKYRGGGRRR